MRAKLSMLSMMYKSLLTHLLYTHTNSLKGTASPTVEKESFQRSLLAAQLANRKTNGKKAEDAPPVNIGWDSHKPVVSSIDDDYMLICVLSDAEICVLNENQYYYMFILLNTSTHILLT